MERKIRTTREVVHIKEITEQEFPNTDDEINIHKKMSILISFFQGKPLLIINLLLLVLLLLSNFDKIDTIIDLITLIFR